MSKIVAAYSYTDADGILRYQVVRYEPKAFRQRRPDGNGDWIWNLDGVQPLLYHLPDVLRADPGKPIFVVEGEKDADALWELGLVATCNSGGAGKWLEKHSEVLRDRNVVPIPDNDLPGRRHIVQVCHSLLGKAGAIRVVELPTGKDTFDWLETGGTKEQLRKLYRTASTIRTESDLAALEGRWFRRDRGDPGTQHGITSLSQVPSIWTLEAKRDWLVENLIAEGSVTLITSESGTGKTWLAYDLAGRVAHGREFLGNAVQQRKVLYLDGENPIFVVKQRLHDLGITETENLIVWGGWNDSPPPGPGDPIVMEFARQEKGLIVFDSLREFHTGSEQDSTETRDFMRRFRRLANLGASATILHNTGKSDTSKQYRGSSDVKAAVDQAYLLQPVSTANGKLDKLSVRCFKGRIAPGQDFGLSFKPGQGFVPCTIPMGLFTTSEQSRSLFKTTHEVIKSILRQRPNSNQTEIVKLARKEGFSKHQIEAGLKAGPWVTTPGKGRAILYSLPEDANGSSIEDPTPDEEFLEEIV